MTRRARAALLASLPLLCGSCVAVVPVPLPVTRPAPQAVPIPAKPPEAPADYIGSFDLAGSFTQGGLFTGRTAPGTTALTLDGKPVRYGADGRFVVGLDRDAPATVRLVALRGGDQFSRMIAIAPRAWKIQSLPTLPKGTPTTPEFQRRRAAEIAQINTARAMNPVTEGWRQRFVWPATGRITGPFGAQRIYAGEPGAYHSGTDIARPAGTPVAAPADGVVILATPAPFTIEGNLILIDHGMGLSSALMHLSRIDVRVGDRVVQGQTVGAVGATGRATGPHLHWGLKWNDARLDPELIAGPMPGRLSSQPPSAKARESSF